MEWVSAVNKHVAVELAFGSSYFGLQIFFEYLQFPQGSLRTGTRSEHRLHFCQPLQLNMYVMYSKGLHRYTEVLFTAVKVLNVLLELQL